MAVGNSNKLTLGLILSVGAFVVIIVGLLLSATGIGACLGIPVIIAAIPFLIWGVICLIQWHYQKAQEIVSAGVQQGIQSARNTPTSPAIVPPLPPEKPNSH